MGPIEKQIRDRILDRWSPVHLEVLNESHQHSGSAEESHFKVLVISEKFDGISRLKRQQSMDTLMRDLLDGPVHAFSQRLLTPEEAKKAGEMPESPNCRGGSVI